MNPSPPSQRSLADYTSLSLIIPQLHGRMTTAVMQELSEVLHHEEVTVSDHLFRNLAALNRELLTGKSSDFGAAFPQVIVPTLKRPRFALGRSPESLPWRVKWLPAIQLVFLIAGPSKNDLEYQQLVAALRRLGKDRLRLDDLLNAYNGEQMLGLLAQYPMEAENQFSKVSGALPILLTT
jgi:mannitol/fructose-specific phosphotransferase system IIA component (Ntr-type)